MARISKRQAKKVAKAVKKHPKTALVLAILFIIICIVGYFVYKNYFNKKDQPITGEFSIHFFPLGNISPGDCVFIKAGDNDILIDAGSTTGSATSIKNYVDRFCEDGILEYVIATHSDYDHIAAFTGDNGIFAYYTCKVIIDFPLTNKGRTEDESATYKDYVARRDAEVANENAVHYTALECWNEENGAKREFQLTDSITMKILYNYYYEHDSKDENNYSVCTMFTHGIRNFLFTGDLEEDGEEKLVEYYGNNLPQVELFKAGHHGSKTSSNKVLLEKIKPKICVISCVAGDNKYNFPKQEALNRILAIKDCRIYVPVYRDANGKPQLLNGEIVIISTEIEIKVQCSNNDTLFQNTEWFKNNRVG